MLLSMTGYGEAEEAGDAVSVIVEVRAVNNRYLKINFRSSGRGSGDETWVEKIVRQHVKRGTVNVQVRTVDSDDHASFRLNTEILNAYREQLQEFHRQHPMDGHITLDSLLNLPGVVEESSNPRTKDETVPLTEQALVAALKNLNQMRSVEGQAMGHDMLQNIDAIKAQLVLIEGRVSQVTLDYTTRLGERVAKLLESYGTTVQAQDIAREVALFSERSDISEEVVRLHSHLEQFCETMKATEGIGRRLEFVSQEMFRETNTIGSKANDTEISKYVIEIKAAIERIREMVQNLE
jgi:uncharacterized protein (TIGR00255 family)